MVCDVLSAVLLALTRMNNGSRGMGEMGHDQERVGRPSLALPRPILAEYRRYYEADLALNGQRAY